MSLPDITKFVTLLAAMSVSVERVVEILKGFIPYLNTAATPASAENRRRAILHVIAAAVGSLMAFLASDQIAKLPAAQPLLDLHWLGYAIMGLLTAGGSAFWNHVLDIIGALKTQQENKTTPPSGPGAPVAAPVPAPATPAAGAAAGGK
jgi:hypothetical protein